MSVWISKKGHAFPHTLYPLSAQITPERYLGGSLASASPSGCKSARLSAGLAVPLSFLAVFTDHGQLRHGQVAVFFRPFVHAMLFHLRFRVFLHRVHFAMGHYSRYFHGMSDMFVEFDRVALKLPGGATLRGQIVLIGVLAFLQTAGERSYFLVRRFGCVLRRR